jgi:hypothetical protein
VGNTVTRLGKGRYKIVFRTDGVIYGTVGVNVFFPDSQANDTDTDNMFYGLSRLRNTISNNDYADYNSFNVLYVNVYKRTTSGDILDDGKIHVVIHHK